MERPAEYLDTVKIDKSEIAEYVLLGARVAQKGTNGHWVDQTYRGARTVAHLLSAISGASRESCIKRVAAVGSRTVGRWYHAIVGADQARAFDPETFKVSFYVILARIGGFDLDIGNVRVHPNGSVDVLIAGDWVKVDEEVINACLAERELGAGVVGDSELQKVISAIKEYFDPTATPEEMREIIRRTNVGPIDQSGEYLAVPPKPLDK